MIIFTRFIIFCRLKIKFNQIFVSKQYFIIFFALSLISKTEKTLMPNSSNINIRIVCVANV